ncbi:MAG: cobalamin B12-binding domain-containing protein [Armatimonadota bacterium]
MAEETFERRYGVTMGSDEYETLRGRMKAALLSRDNADAAALAEELAGKPYPLAFIYLEVLAPALDQTTDEWYHKERPFEDVSTAWDQLYVMLPVLRRRLRTVNAVKPPLVVACVEGNEHELGARLLADLLREAGYPIMFAPAGTGRDVIIDEVMARNPACVALSVSLPDQYDELFATGKALREKGYTGKIAAGGVALEIKRIPNYRPHGIDWAGADPLEFIAWLDREVGVKREAA